MVNYDISRYIGLFIIKLQHELPEDILVPVGYRELKNCLVVQSVLTIHEQRNIQSVIKFGDADNVSRLHSAVDYLLLFGSLFYRCDAVPEHGRLFKVKLLSRPFHFRAHTLHGLCTAALNKLHSLIHSAPVVVGAYLSAADAHAQLYMVIQTRSALAEILRKSPLAGWQHEHTVRLVYGFFCYKAAGVRTEVGTALLRVFFVGDTRELLVGNTDIMISLIVFQEDIILGLMLLDKAAFKQQSLKLAVGDDKIIVMHICNHCRDLRRVVGIFAEVAAHTVVQVLGFADINDRAVLFTHDVHSGRGSQL